MEEIHIKQEYPDSDPDEEEPIQTTLTVLKTEILEDKIKVEAPENEHNYEIRNEIQEHEQNYGMKVEIPEDEHNYETKAEIPEDEQDDDIKAEVSDNESDDNNHFVERPHETKAEIPEVKQDDDIPAEVSDKESDDNNHFIERPRMETRLRTSCRQFVVLLEFMERHPYLSHPQQGARGRLRANRMWQDLTEELNSVKGGVPRTIKKWKRVWTNWKVKTKKKASNIRDKASGTGEGPSRRQMLTDLEERLLIFVTRSAVIGQSAAEEHSFDLQLSPDADIKVHSPSPVIKVFQCDYCKKIFLDKWTLETHIYVHMGIVRYPCNVCEKIFTTYEHLKGHLLLKHKKFQSEDEFFFNYQCS